MRRCIILVFAAASLAGCCGSRDVSNDPEFNQGFVPGQTYRLLQDVFVDDVNRLVLPRDSSVPPTAAHYYARPADWPQVKGVVEKGDEVRVERLVMAPWSVRSITVHARVLTGRQAGKRVTLESLSAEELRLNRKWDAYIPAPNTTVLVPTSP